MELGEAKARDMLGMSWGKKTISLAVCFSISVFGG